jgi:intracellular sulfur oxidation DsrE/DsrF family protein
MTESSNDRRGFLGRIASAGALLSVPWAASCAPVAESEAVAAQETDDWMAGVAATRRCLFDFPQHKMGFPLVHILNYLNTYAEAYGVASGEIGTVGTFYGMGGASSIAMGFNDSVWEQYGLGAYLGLRDAVGAPYTRNVFHRPTEGDRHLLTAAITSPDLPMFGNAIVGAGIESLQGMGTKFIMCNNALVGWTFELEARGHGPQAEIESNLRANLLDGITVVPAMVIAIARAQEAGFAYNKQ